VTEIPLIIMLEPEGAFRCNEPECDWVDDPFVHALEVHGVGKDDVMVIHPDDH
jgi:hypothetical protein